MQIEWLKPNAGMSSYQKMRRLHQFLIFLIAASTLLSRATICSASLPSMHAMETAKFNWGLITGHYNVDMGTTVLETHETECWMKDAQGNLVMRWYGAGSGWGAEVRPWAVTPRWPTCQRSYG